jgi:hypothetical protein
MGRRYSQCLRGEVMAKEMMTVFNMETGQEITREMTADELAQLNEAKAKASQDIADAEAREVAKAAILDRLGLTSDEAKILLS